MKLFCRLINYRSGDIQSPSSLLIVNKDETVKDIQSTKENLKSSIATLELLMVATAMKKENDSSEMYHTNTPYSLHLHL